VGTPGRTLQGILKVKKYLQEGKKRKPIFKSCLFLKIGLSYFKLELNYCLAIEASLLRIEIESLYFFNELWDKVT